MRDAGVSVVSSYVFWGLVEPRADEFDFTGPNDIRRVAELCAGLGLLFAPRIGPFNNSEYLLGGLPPWLYGLPLVERSNDPRYLERVRTYYERLGAELRGMFWSDGGPIVIVQLENELSHAPNDWRTLFGYTATDNRGPDAAGFVAHMESLRELALGAGISPAFFAMTGWGIPGDASTGDFLPTYGAYLDLHPQPGPNHVLTTFQGGDYPHRGRYPTAFCELGTGSPARASYRSMTPWESMVVPALTRIASVESIFLGYYLYHGGTNPVRGDGFGWTTKEAAFPLRSYDFWAPISEFGERRESFHRAVPLNRFMLEFGSELATTQVVEPRAPVLDPEEDRLRAVLRAAGDSGFLFFANYGNNHPLEPRDDASFAVSLASGDVEFPRRSRLAIASGASGMFPLGLELGHGVTLVSATAQPFARLGDERHPQVVFHAPAGSEVEYTLAGVHPASITAVADIHPEGAGATVVLRIESAARFSVAGPTGTVTVVTIPSHDAEHSLVVDSARGRRLVTGDVELSWVGDDIELFGIRPLSERNGVPTTLREPVTGAELRAELPAPSLRPEHLSVERIGEGRALLRVRDPGVDISELWIDIDYTGDLARLFDASTGILVADDFSRGIPWRVKLGRFEGALRGGGLQLRVEPVSTLVEVPNEEGILLDHTEEVVGDARIDSLALLQRVSTRIPIAAFDRSEG